MEKKYGAQLQCRLIIMEEGKKYKSVKLLEGKHTSASSGRNTELLYV